jgi:hypothetical protein
MALDDDDDGVTMMTMGSGLLIIIIWTHYCPDVDESENGNSLI